jgi:hypothetical protein
MTRKLSKKCALCGSNKTTPLERGVKDLVSLEVFDVYSCASCLVGYTNPIPKNLEDYYNQENYDSYQKKKGVFSSIYSLIQRINNRYKVNIIKRYGVGSLLDYGAGSGNFVDHANRVGYKSIGFEPINKSLNKNITNNMAIIKKSKYKFITLWHVLEHTKKPKELLYNIKGLLSKGGKIMIAVPNNGSYDNIYYKKNWAGYDVPRHVFHFNKNSLKGLLSDVKLSVVGSKPLYFDSFYVSMLSEKQKKNPLWFVFGFFIGLASNISAFFTKKHSSIIYIIE